MEECYFWESCRLQISTWIKPDRAEKALSNYYGEPQQNTNKNKNSNKDKNNFLVIFVCPQNVNYLIYHQSFLYKLCKTKIKKITTSTKNKWYDTGLYFLVSKINKNKSI